MKTTNGQLMLFDEPPLPKHPSKPSGEQVLRSLAVLYTATEKGNSTGPRYIMTVEDAMKFCSDPRSGGAVHGTRWAFFWSSLYNYANCYWMRSEEDDGPQYIDLTSLYDDGRFDWLIKELGIAPVSLEKLKDLETNYDVAIDLPKKTPKKNA